jgi:hypothetical protein
MSATPNLGRSSSTDSHNRSRTSTAIQLQDMIFRMPNIDSVDDINIVTKDSVSAPGMRLGSISSMSTATLHPGIRESIQLGSGDEDSFMSAEKQNFKKAPGSNVKCLYMSPESDTIRNAIKSSIRDQLVKCRTPEAANNLIATTPVLQAMCGYACARCENGDAEALEAYAEGALGDQVRIMRSLVNVFLSTHHSSESGDLFARTSEEKTAAADESLLGAEKDDEIHGTSLVLTCAQVERFLKHAVDFGDMMGLQVNF